MLPVHDRMPVAVRPDAWRAWVDPSVQNPRELAPLLPPPEDAFLSRRRVGQYVNNVRNEGAACIQPA